ncbi:hypothetical protein SFC76_12200 [Sphingomonas sp. CD22]|uniref:hypothetical protein n=1 Tax=Sphingomonas sp. CD22 TaxID=3100214 RepID=UPI002ADF52D1|nr:hypothetical protein [Sphingomonas sp. CD22]MEA1085023.1 hypothetical protein [Sphingomonas sp. CD22]
MATGETRHTFRTMVSAPHDLHHAPPVIADLDLLLRGGATGLLMLAAVMSARAWFDDAFRPTPV